MTTFRYDTSNSWFKGNTHLHSVVSDGGLTFPEIEQKYLQTGHDFLFRTDHRIASDCAADDWDSTLLWIDGVELDGTDETGAYYHVVCLGEVTTQGRDTSLTEALERNRDMGATLILAHPHWSGNTLEDARRHGFHGVEVYNNVCHWLNGKGSGAVHWEAMLRDDPQTLGLSVDDAHLKPEHPTYNGGWIVVNAPERSRDAILEGVRAGNFYSSQGPEIHSLTFEDGTLSASFSPVQFARLVGPGSKGIRAPYLPPEESMTEVSFEVDPNARGFLYLELVDADGRRAWTNNLFA